MRLVKRTVGAFVMALASMLVAQPTMAQENMVDTVKKRGNLKVGFATFVPWAMRDKQGKFVGFEIDVAAKVAKDMGVELDLQPTAWDGIIPSLIGGKFDLIIGGMTVTPARREQIDFSDPYSVSGLGTVANKQLASKMTWPTDYNSSAVTFACRRGSSPCLYIEKTFPKATVRQFDDNGLGIQEVINGNAHAWISTEPFPSFKAIQHPEKLFKASSELFEGGIEGMGIKKGNPAMLKVLNEWIAKNQTFLKERRAYWFSTQEWASQVPAF